MSRMSTVRVLVLVVVFITVVALAFLPGQLLLFSEIGLAQKLHGHIHQDCLL